MVRLNPIYVTKIKNMKRLFIIIFSFFTIPCFGQTPYPPGSYNAKPELDKFVGTWRWVSGNDTLTIHFFKQAIHYPSPLDYDVEGLVGWHKYIKNGVLSESSLQYSGLPRHGGHSTLLAWNQTPTKLYGVFSDLSKDKRCDLYLEMTNASYNQMTWKLKESRGIKPSGFQYGFTLPTNLVLTKQ